MYEFANDYNITDDETVYTIIKIEEEDFGCEGRPEGYVPMVKVFLESNISTTTIMMEDALMYTRNLDVGSEVIISNDGSLVSAALCLESLEPSGPDTEIQSQWIQNYLDAVEEMEEEPRKIEK